MPQRKLFSIITPLSTKKTHVIEIYKYLKSPSERIRQLKAT